MTYLILHRCGDRLFDPEGYERTAEFWKWMKPQGEGYYVLVARPIPTESQAADAVVAGPFVRLCNAQAVAADIEQAVAIGALRDVVQLSPSDCASRAAARTSARSV